MKILAEAQHLLASHKAELWERFGVHRLVVFGSYARSEATPLSDVDILVDFERPIGWEVVDLHNYLEELLGLSVDLVTEGALRRKPRLWQSVQEDLIHV